jgi:hypothetical protein
MCIRDSRIEREGFKQDKGVVTGNPAVPDALERTTAVGIGDFADIVGMDGLQGQTERVDQLGAIDFIFGIAAEVGVGAGNQGRRVLAEFFFGDPLERIGLRLGNPDVVEGGIDEVFALVFDQRQAKIKVVVDIQDRLDLLDESALFDRLNRIDVDFQTSEFHKYSPFG